MVPKSSKPAKQKKQAPKSSKPCKQKKQAELGPRSHQRYRSDFDGVKANYDTQYNNRKNKNDNNNNNNNNNNDDDDDDDDNDSENDTSDSENDAVTSKKGNKRTQSKLELEEDNILLNVVKKRKTYSEKTKQEILEFYDDYLSKQAENGGKVVKAEAVVAVNNHHPDWTFITAGRIEQWKAILKNKGKCNSGRGQKKADDTFYRILLNKIWMKIVDEMKSDEYQEGVDLTTKIDRIANICYSYSIIQETAEKSREEWLNSRPMIESDDDDYAGEMEMRRILLKKNFKEKWIHGFLTDFCFKDKMTSTTRDEKKIPEDDLILKMMTEIEDKIKNKTYPPNKQRKFIWTLSLLKNFTCPAPLP